MKISVEDITFRASALFASRQQSIFLFSVRHQHDFFYSRTKMKVFLLKTHGTKEEKAVELQLFYTFVPAALPPAGRFPEPFSAGRKGKG